MDMFAERRKAAEQSKAARESCDAASAGTSDAEERRLSAGPFVPEQHAAIRAVGHGLASSAQNASEGHALTGGFSGTPEEGSEQELEMLAFVLGGEEYVLPVDEVHEVLKLGEITPVPHTPNHLVGVCSLRGTVLPVVDLARRLGFAPCAYDDKCRIIVTGSDADDRVGLLVDRVGSVIRFPASIVRPVPDTVERGVEFLRGIARQDHRLLILLDAEKAAMVG
jgi:purine-binding chemotaxis protein CheW